MGVPPMWAHQEEAVKAIVGEIGGGGRCQAVMACATGKTRVGAEVSAQVAPDGKVLVAVPTLDLLAQTAREWSAVLGNGAGLTGAVCSGTWRQDAGAGELPDEIRRLHAGWSTDPAEVASWLRRPGRATILATYQSLDIAAAAAREAGTRWDLAVADEAHRTAGITGGSWSLFHDDAGFQADRRLYMTATPRVMESEQHEVTSMDDEAVFGPEAFRLPFGAAIRDGLLADYRVAVSVVTEAEVARLARPGAVVSAGGMPVTGAMLAAQVALLKACARWDLRRVITYHRRVASAHRFAQTLLNAADLLPDKARPRLLRVEAIDGGMPQWRRRDVLRHLGDTGGHTVVVSNARVLSEGVDVPELDAVMFADPRDSATDVVQAVGRALRKGAREGKTATVIVPLLLTEGETPEAALDGSAYDMAWRVVRALRAHDERLAGWLDALRIRGAADGPRNRGAGMPPAWLDLSGIPVTSAFAAALQVRMVSAASSPWVAGYGHAAAWHAEHGHLAVPHRHVTEAGYPLGQWVGKQRQLRKAGQLARDRQEKLDAIGMRWDEFGARWEQAYGHAAQWFRKHGHLEVPRGCATGEDQFKLGSWVVNQRQRQRAGRLPEAQARALDAIGMRWDADWRWQAGLAAARAFHAEHGHLNIPKWRPVAGGIDLYQWVQTRRQDRREGKLGAGRIAELDALGIKWSPHEAAWDDGLAALAAFRARHGHARVPRGTRTAAGADLLTWLANRRQDYRNGTLAQEKAGALEALGVAWEPYVQDWLDGLADCAEFRAEHGHLDIPPRQRGARKAALGKWLQDERAEYRAGTLPPDRAAALEGLGVSWNGARGDVREDMHAALRAWHAANGTASVPAGHVTPGGLKLGQWLANKKATARRGGKIHPDTRALLRELRADWA